MRLTDILTEQRILVDVAGTVVRTKDAALVELAKLISPAIGIEPGAVYQLLQDRERLQSTGIGDGVAIPHASTDATHAQAAALIICPTGIDFQAIDNANVHIVFGVVGPRRATGDHLKTLARISRLLRDVSSRNRLVASTDAASVYSLVQLQEAAF